MSQSVLSKVKKFIDKVMFLTAVARPRFDEFGNQVFVGKIGIFPFIHKELTKYNNKNRPAGIMVTSHNIGYERCLYILFDT